MTPSETATITDSRFKSLHTDPRFLRPGKRAKKKNVVDDRFQHVIKKNDSHEGRNKGPAKKTSSKTTSRSKKSTSSFVDLARGQALLESSDEEECSESETGKVYFESSQSESDDDDGELELGGPSGKRRRTRSDELTDAIDVDLDESRLPTISDPSNSIQKTRRIAVVNLDWDHVKPIDLFKVFSSLLSPTAPPRSSLQVGVDGNGIKKTEKHMMVKGHVVKVSIYKSQFGKEQMSKEDVEGPPRELFKDGPRTSDHNADGHTSDDQSSEDEVIVDDDNPELDDEALRRYQLNRLRYFYAIVELDSVDAAAHVYEQIEGAEFERTANVFDLSYVPEDMVFEEADLHDECKEDTANYKGVDYATDALRHSKVKLTWDAEDPHRAKVTRLNTQKMSREDLDELDFKAFIAPPSSDEEEELSDGAEDVHLKQSAGRSKLRDLLGLSNLTSSKSNDTGELDITFVPAFSKKQALEPSSTGPLPPSKSRKTKINSEAETPDSNLNRTYEPNEEDSDQDENPSRRSQKQTRRKNKPNTSPDASADKIEVQASGEAELTLLFDSIEEIDPTRAHFDLNQIVKAEKLKGRSRALKKRKSSKHQEMVEDHFDINTSDNRFAMVYNDHEFAIDPSNPQYKPTKNMSKLLETARSQRKLEGDTDEKLTGGKTSQKPESVVSDRSDTRLNALVATLKGKSESQKKRKR